MSEIIPSELEPFPARPKWIPSFLREIEEIGKEMGFVEAFHQILQNAHVSVHVEGDVDQIKEHDGGILFVGNHKRRWEFVALADVLRQVDRNGLLNIAKFYVQYQGYKALGNVAATEYIAPVYPRILARDRPNIFNYEFLNRLKFHDQLLSFAESEEANTRSLARASRLLVEGGTVNIHPTGCVKDATMHIWRPGVGRIIQQIPDVYKEDVLIAPYSLEKFSQTQFLGAIATRGSGLFGSQILDMKLGSLQTAQGLVDTLPGVDREDPWAITEVLRQQFIDDFTRR